MAKVKIVSITLKADKVEEGMPTQYTVGEPPIEGAAVVEKIVHHKHAYNSGFQGDFPCYAIHLADGVRRIVPVADMPAFVDVAKIEAQPVDDSGPAVATEGDQV